MSNFRVEINRPVDCQTRNILYCISCDRCPAQYVGQSERSLQDRFSEHRGYVTSRNMSKATGKHFSQNGHQISDMKVTIIEKVFSPHEAVRLEREKHFIKQMNTKYKGLNRKI